MRSLLCGGGIGLIVLLGGCAAPAQPAGSMAVGCTGSNPQHRAYVVVEHMSGASIERCVGFSGDLIDGQTLMDRSGIEYQSRSVSSGKVVCQVDGEPAQFNECFPQNRPYWALFIDSSGRWSSATGGYTDLRLRDGEAIGWHYVQATDPAPSPPPYPR